MTTQKTLRTLLIMVAVAAFCTACNLVSSSDITPTPALPSVTFQYPQNDATFNEGDEIVIGLAAQDSNGTGIARVQLLVDDILHHEGLPEVSAAVPVFTVEMNWLAQGIGLHAFTAIAYRLDGTPSAPATIRILVQPAAEAGPTSPPQQVG